MNDKLWALAMAGCGTYAPGLEKLYMPRKGNVRMRRLKRVKLSYDDKTIEEMYEQ